MKHDTVLPRGYTSSNTSFDSLKKIKAGSAPYFKEDCERCSLQKCLDGDGKWICLKGRLTKAIYAEEELSDFCANLVQSIVAFRVEAKRFGQDVLKDKLFKHLYTTGTNLKRDELRYYKVRKEAAMDIKVEEELESIYRIALDIERFMATIIDELERKIVGTFLFLSCEDGGITVVEVAKILEEKVHRVRYVLDKHRANMQLAFKSYRPES